MTTQQSVIIVLCCVAYGCAGMGALIWRQGPIRDWPEQISRRMNQQGAASVLPAEIFVVLLAFLMAIVLLIWPVLVAYLAWSYVRYYLWHVPRWHHREACKHPSPCKNQPVK